MKYEANLSSTSLNKVIKELKKQKRLYEKTMVKEFFFECCRKIIEYANENIRDYEIGKNVLFEIMTEWEYVGSFTGHSIVLRNVAEKAAYVEFGVGIVAEGEPHPLAYKVGYEYNVPSVAKMFSSTINYNMKNFEEGTWVFYQNLDDLDLPLSALQDRIYFNEPERDRTRMLIRTQGTEPTMFLYKAVLRFVNAGDAKIIWERIKREYWG